jgi:hypothetical protein
MSGVTEHPGVSGHGAVLNPSSMAQARPRIAISPATTRTEREAFSAGTHVGVISVTQEGGAPLVLSLWYAYEPGGEVRIDCSKNRSLHSR